MTALETLAKLLEASGLEKCIADFASGAHSLGESRTPATPAEARQALEDAVAGGFAHGWILFDEELVEPDGAPSLPDAGFPLAAELANPQTNQSLRLAQTASGWSISTVSRNEDAEGLLETTAHRRTGGGEIRHEVAWVPDSSGTLRPASARITPSS